MLSRAITHADDGLSVVPLRSPTLPPAEHTNMIWVGKERRWIVDPAAHTSVEQERALEIIRGAADEASWAGVLLTHHHNDHVGAARLLSQELKVPIVAHERTAELLVDRLQVDQRLVEGDIISGGQAPDDQWHVLHTPGHASGHIVLWEPIRGWMIGGDMMAAVGTIVIEPPDGHMTTYLEQLDRLAQLNPKRFIPAHGGVIEDPVERLQYYTAHRLKREARVRDALSDQAADLGTVTQGSYPELARVLLPLAERSCLAHLIRLEEQGEAIQEGALWSRA
jgi:glyoxylase-like metal-dependent hydrolase (beta-lactamase superfamily II)